MSTSRTSSPTAKLKKVSKYPSGAGKGRKSAQIIRLLKRPNGATLAELMQATEWQAHSVRGYLSGALRSKMALLVERFARDKEESAYRISEEKSQVSSAPTAEVAAKRTRRTAA